MDAYLWNMVRSCGVDATLENRRNLLEVAARNFNFGALFRLTRDIELLKSML